MASARPLWSVVHFLVGLVRFLVGLPCARSWRGFWLFAFCAPLFSFCALPCLAPPSAPARPARGVGLRFVPSGTVFAPLLCVGGACCAALRFFFSPRFPRWLGGSQCVLLLFRLLRRLCLFRLRVFPRCPVSPLRRLRRRSLLRPLPVRPRVLPSRFCSPLPPPGAQPPSAFGVAGLPPSLVAVLLPAVRLPPSSRAVVGVGSVGAGFPPRRFARPASSIPTNLTSPLFCPGAPRPRAFLRPALAVLAVFAARPARPSLSRFV